MDTLEKLIEEKERLEIFLKGDLAIIPKYTGNTIVAKYKGSEEKYYKKKNGGIVTMIDILTTDLYSEPISYLTSIRDCFKDGLYFFTNNYDTGNIILDYSNYYEPNIFPKDDVLKICTPITNTKIINNHLKELILTNDTVGIMEILGMDENISKIFVKDIKNPNNIFSIQNPNRKNHYTVPSDMYGIIQADLIRRIDCESLKNTLFDLENKDVTYVHIVNKIFCEYLKNNIKYDISNINLGYPDNMKVKDINTKKYLLDREVSDIIGLNTNLYDFYCMIMLTLKQKSLIANDNISENNIKKFEVIKQIVSDICNDPLGNTSTPSYSVN
jgi:hypothetical protein